MPEKTWGQVFKDPALIITFLITTQFFALIIFFSVWRSQMAMEAKQVILQSYVVGFTASWGYWLGSSASSRDKSETLKQESRNNHVTTAAPQQAAPQPPVQ